MSTTDPLVDLMDHESDPDPGSVGLSYRMICCPRTRCGLCQFYLEAGEWVCIVLAHQEEGAIPFQYRPGSLVHDPVRYLTICVCGHEYCRKDWTRADCFHVECFRTCPMPVTPEFLIATSYLFDPPRSEERRRRVFIEKALFAKLSADPWLTRLPPEICQTIVRLLINECAAVNLLNIHAASGQLMEQFHVESPMDGDGLVSRTTSYTVSLCNDLYVYYLMIEGRRYIQCIWDTKARGPPARKEDHLMAELWSAGKGDPRTARSIWVEEDHIGIRQIHFFYGEEPFNPPIDPLNPDPRGWWREIIRPLNDDSQRSDSLTVLSDGMKARFILHTCSPELSCHAGFPTPVRPRHVVDIHTARPAYITATKESLPLVRFASFMCNHKDTMGYSVLLDGADIAMIHHHLRTESPMNVSFYSDAPPSPKPQHWVFLPIVPGEYLTGIGRRGSISSPRRRNERGILFLTNLGRVRLFGSYLRDPSGIPGPTQQVDFNQETTYDVIHTPVPAPEHSTVYYNTAVNMPDNRKQDLMCFDTFNHPVSPRQWPEELRSIRRGPSTGEPPYFHSWCSLRNVTEITPCVDTVMGRKRVLGMLLKYSDGWVECVGHFRWDKAVRSGGGTTTPIRVFTDTLEPLHMACERVKDGDSRERLFIGDVHNDRWCDPTQHWIHLPWDGILEWWFGPQHTRVSHTHLVETSWSDFLDETCETSTDDGWETETDTTVSVVMDETT